MISQYWIGQIPARPLSILVKNQDGSDFNLSGYTTINVKMLDTDNKEGKDYRGGVCTSKDRQEQLYQQLKLQD